MYYDIADTAVKAGSFSTVTAIKAAKLVDTLKGAGPFTVLQSMRAFAKLKRHCRRLA